ncbi:MAG: AI-2E family transporter [Dehalococcoidia bacterium]|nr:AI-2E family transporter [Dehalococcoidia bacterium]
MSTVGSSLNKLARPLLVLLLIVIILWLVAASMAVLIPFLVGILLAYMLMPIVTWLEKILPPRRKAHKARRIISIILVFIAFSILLVLFIIYIGATLVSASGALADKAPGFIVQSVDIINAWIAEFGGSMPQAFVGQYESMIANLGPAASKFIQDFIVGSIALIPASMPTVLGFFVLPFFLFFILNDYESFQKFFYDYLPTNAARHTASILTIIGNAMGSYLRSQLILGLIVGTMVFIGLSVLNVQYAPALAAVTTVTQFIPIIGPVFSGLLVLLVTLALQPDKVLWALIVFIVAQAILNTVFVNWLQGKYMKIHPAIVMVLLVVGGYIAGLWGAILALPVGATVWQIYLYFRNQQTAVVVET